MIGVIKPSCLFHLEGGDAMNYFIRWDSFRAHSP